MTLSYSKYPIFGGFSGPIGAYGPRNPFWRLEFFSLTKILIRLDYYPFFGRSVYYLLFREREREGIEFYLIFVCLRKGSKKSHFRSKKKSRKIHTRPDLLLEREREIVSVGFYLISVCLRKGSKKSHFRLKEKIKKNPYQKGPLI